MKYIVAIKINGETEFYEFGTEFAMNEFLKYILIEAPDLEYSTTTEDTP